MKNQKDLFDLFRESESQLSERPSSEAWRRLEAKLDERKQRRRTSTTRQVLSIAAALLLLATIGIAFSLQNNTDSVLASKEMPTTLEELSSADALAMDQPLKVVEFTRKHVSRLANPVAEGAAGKKLIPNMR